MSAIAIRPARPEDVPTLGRMGASLARFHHLLDPRRFFGRRSMRPGYGSWLGRELRSPEAVVLVASVKEGDGERLVGYAYGRLEGQDWNSLRGPAGVAIDLWVDRPAREGGTGRRLLDALVRELVARGAPRVVLHVAARNPRALALFEAMGFRRTMVELTIEAEAASR